MGSKKRAKAKKKNAAEMMKERQTVAEKTAADRTVVENPTEETTVEAKIFENLTEETAVEVKEFVENKGEASSAEESKEVLNKTGQSDGKKSVSQFFRSFGNAFKAFVKNAGVGVYVSAAVGMVLLITVILLSIRLGSMSKEFESVQAMSVSLKEELEIVKRDRDEAELELFSIEPQTVYVEVYPTATPEPTPEPTVTPEPIKYVVCVDAGHGDWDGGAAVLGENYQILRAEKDDNLRMAKLFRDALLEYEDVEVVMTRENDVFMELSKRSDIANEAEADALISFHRNSYDGEGDVSGVEFWIHSSRPKDAQALASDMLNAIMRVGGMNSRGVKGGSMSSFREDYSINRRSSMTSMIVELGFISSEKDNAAYDENGKAYAEEMAKAVHDWLLLKNESKK